jgi:hypothetical protein
MIMKKIIKNIVDSVREAMKDAIESGYDYMNFEKVCGDAAVYVDVREVRLSNGMYIDDLDVCVYHAEGSHQSPRLESAIRSAIPNWFDVKEEVSGRRN